MSKTTMTGTDIRRSFLEHFAAKGHVIVPSSSLVPDNDPTLMFTNSGMVQFKNNFTGVDTRLKRAASSQRCVRAGGKHNDLENVGVTARHHTFFEMLGNFSFGDYFKKESLEWSWEWVTETLKLDPARICVTVYHDDDEAAAIWRKIGIADKDIIRIASSANFWTMGETGPCGPCSEIFYDLDPTGKQVTGGRPGTPEEDGDRWMEIWNNVFTQFDLQKDGTKVPLKNKNIDTGAGLERIMCAVQGVYSNYDTDVFQHLIGAAAKVAGTEYRHSAEAGDVSLRVIADHLRAMTFLMIDGVMPSNEGRGYVLRRIMRRAMRHGHLLGVEKPFINGLVPTLVGIMGDAYPELQRGAAMAMDVIKLEEERFGKTLKQGMALLNDATKALKKGDMLEGEVAFKLYDTYGFPLDLTQDALKDRGIGVNDDGFQNAMAEQKARARAAFKGSGDSKLSEIWFDVQEAAGKTEFLGYQVTQAEGVIKDLVADGKRVESLRKGQKGAILVTQTPFYAESGGQVGDTGVINGDSWKFTVTDTQKVLDGVWVHHGEVSEGTVKIGANAELHVDEVRREAIMRNHSVTHLLNAALREILGTHVVQRGSRQDEFGTRFDISHPKGITPEELGRIERWVNERVWMNVPVVTRILPKEDAVQSGAVAQFGEKYGDEVRVVYMGNPDSTRLITADLCGGTHVGMTGEIGLFRITGESSVAAGIRRVEGVTHMRALESFNADAGIVKEVAALVKSKPAQIVERVTAIQKGAKAGAKAAGGSVDVAALLGKAEERGGFKIVVSEVKDADGDALRVAVEDLKGRLGSGVILLGSDVDGKVSLVAGVTKDLAGKISAGSVVKAACDAIGGRGGGKPELAMGGGAGDVSGALAAGKGAIAA